MPCNSPRCSQAANAGYAGIDEDSIRLPLITWATAIGHVSIGDRSSLRIATERILALVPVIVGFQAGLGRTEPRVCAAARVEQFTTSAAPWAPSRTITELQERQAMTQTLESGIKSEHSKGKRTGGDGAQTTNAEQRSFGYRRARKQVGYGIAIQRVVG
jgi:hypothetical protein